MCDGSCRPNVCVHWGVGGSPHGAGMAAGIDLDVQAAAEEGELPMHRVGKCAV